MITVRQIERLWDDRQYLRLSTTLVDGRSDIDAEMAAQLKTSAAAAAALAVIRLDELGQNARPICSRLIRALIATQQQDGGWGDVAVTVLALRALRCARGEGEAVARGFDFVASLQKDDGAWPAEPIRRLAGDPATTAFVLLHLATDSAFAGAADLEGALTWLARHRDQMDAPARRQADRAAARCRLSRGDRPESSQAASLFAGSLNWS